MALRGDSASGTLTVIGGTIASTAVINTVSLSTLNVQSANIASGAQILGAGSLVLFEYRPHPLLDLPVRPPALTLLCCSCSALLSGTTVTGPTDATKIVPSISTPCLAALRAPSPPSDVLCFA